MRKLFSLFAAVLFAGSMFAADVEIAKGTFNGKEGIYTTGWTVTGTGTSRTDCVVVGKDESITSPAVDLSDYQSITIKIKARKFGSLAGSKATVVVKFGTTTIGSVDLTSTSATSDADAINYINESLTTGSFEFTCSNATSAGSTHGAGFNTIEIVGVKKSTSSVANPSFSPLDEEFEGTLNVTLTCATEGAKIYYTLDNTDPTSSSIEYTGAIELTATTTVKAIAVKDAETSDIVSKTYTKIERLTCAQFAALADDAIAYLNDVVVTYNPGDNKNLWVKDATGALQIYATGGYSIETGSTIHGLKGTKATYKGLVEFKPTVGKAALEITAGEAPEPEVLAAITDADVSKYVLIKNISVDGEFVEGTASNITIEVGGEEIVLRSNFKNAFEFDAAKQYDIVCLVSYFNALQLYFISATESTTTAIDNNAVEAKAVKFIRNGQIFIEREGKIYNVLGTCVK